MPPFLSHAEPKLAGVQAYVLVLLHAPFVQAGTELPVSTMHNGDVPVGIGGGDGLGHVTPHPPQLFTSVERAAHVPEQLVSPVPQENVQAPPTHARPLAHALPHEPQLAESVW